MCRHRIWSISQSPWESRVYAGFVGAADDPAKGPHFFDGVRFLCVSTPEMHRKMEAYPRGPFRYQLNAQTCSPIASQI